MSDWNFIHVTRAELLARAQRTFANEKMDPVDAKVNIDLREVERQAMLRWLRETPVVLAGAFFEEVDCGHASRLCFCPTFHIYTTLNPFDWKGPAGDVKRLPWSFIRAWDHEWGVYLYDGAPTEYHRAVIVVEA